MSALKSQAHAQGYSEGYHAAERDLYREIDALRKDKARLDWLLENKYARGPEQDLSKCKHTCAKSYQLIYTRKSIDREMTASGYKNMGEAR